ncbi:hypothetical protein BJF79_04865 [Actinomadura sp. CNU-125]|uniref:hypothetical protein n=1 Tax=Actinomadura sp. CNU-125 TaxID=1904961 RepID=UPI00096118F8|nr:hypothetical protein [Actinomadura sp. CNU-125]OLT10064.1 hypothetical protein BJF79_04865 [Actinomadura sp. CNU-125]
MVSAHVSLHDWMARRLAEDHRFLDAAAAGDLLKAEKVMPVLDGLDELAPGARATAVAAVDGWARDGRPVVLTCRGDEYEDAVRESGHPLSRAPVVEIGAVDAVDAARYLRAAALDGDTRWDPLLGRLAGDPDGPLATALATPLMVELLRIGYRAPATDPAELLDAERFPSREAIEGHLIDRFLPALYAPAQRPAYRAEQAERWLAHLARRMRRHGTRNLSWGQIWTLPSALLLTLPFALTGGLVFGSFFGAGRGLAAAALFALAAVMSHIPGAAPRHVHDSDLTDPMALLRRLRGGSAVWALLVAVASGLLIGTLFGLGLDATTGKTIGYALLLGSMFAVGALGSTPWGSFLLARSWFALIGRLPFRLVAFLRDAHERGALRQVGAVYQFRHALVHDRLTGDASPWPEDPPGRARSSLRSVTLVRVGVQVLGVLIAAMLLTAPLTRGALVYRSGDRPAEENLAAPGTSITTSVPHWTLPPGAARRTVFAQEDPDDRFPVSGLATNVALERACPGTVVEFTAIAGGRTVSHIVLRARGSSPRKETLPREDFPAGAGDVTVLLKRVDDAGCTVGFRWQAPRITHDGFFDIREYLRS